MKALFKGKRLLMLTASVMAIAVVFASVMIFKVNAADIDETNPDLKYAQINSDLETSFSSPSYTPSGELSQKGGKYILTSNAYCVWLGVDDVSFAYRKYNVLPTGEDYLEIGTTVESLDAVQGNIHENASVGLMVRSGMNPDDSEVFLHCRSKGITIVYRSKKGNGTGVRYTDIDIKYPVQFKMTIKKNQVICSYKNANSSNFITATPVAFKFDGPIYAGIGIHSVDEHTFVKSVCNGFTAKGIGNYDGKDDNSSSSSGGDVIEPCDPDVELTDKDILLRETFTDGSMTDKKMAVGEWDWGNPQYSNLKVVNGNRVWLKDLTEDSEDYVGDEHWTDYEVRANFRYTENIDKDATNASNTFKLFARHTYNPFYGHSDYSAVAKNVVDGTKQETRIYLYKRTNQYSAGSGVALGYYVADDLFDHMWHELGLRVFDNKIDVYYDGKTVISYTDTGYFEDGTSNSGSTYNGGIITADIHGTGNIGIATNETSVMIDDIIVRKLDDPLGGDYDNAIADNWDSEVPDYIKQWVDSGKPFDNKIK